MGNREQRTGNGETDPESRREDYGLGANPPGSQLHLSDIPRRMDDYYSAEFYRKSLGQARENLEFEPDGTVLHIKPLQYTLGLGVPGLLLMLTALWMHFSGNSYGLDFHDAQGNDYIGLVKLLAMLGGGIMLIIAWPVRKPAGWSVAEQEQYEDSKQEAANKRWREH